MNEQDTAYGEREADYYEQCPDQTVVCRLCPHECHLGEGRQGRCRSRTNRGGKLYTLAYGRVCALHTDPVEKKPLFHFLPGSRCFSLAAAGCNLSCQNCQNWEISQASPLEVGCRRITPERLGETAACSGCRSVAYTYTEPLTYLEFTRDCAAACKAKGLKNILVTAGYVNEKPLADLLPYIDAANIDLKSFSDDTYRCISHAHLAPILRTLLQMKEAGVWIEITNLVIPSVNDTHEQVRTLCRWLADNGLADSPLHFSRFFPAIVWAIFRPPRWKRSFRPGRPPVKKGCGSSTSATQTCPVQKTPAVRTAENGWFAATSIRFRPTVSAAVAPTADSPYRAYGLNAGQ